MIRKLMIVLVVLGAALLGVIAVAAQDDSAGTRVELIGLVEAMTTTTLTVNQQVVDVSGAQFTVAVSLGMPVKVEGVVGPTGGIIAREVKSPDDDSTSGLLPGEIELVGLLTAVNGSSYTVAGLTVDGSAAQIKAGVAVGQVVKVHASLNAAGAWVAREIELDGDDDGDGIIDDNGNDNGVGNVNDNSVSNANDNSSNDNTDDDNSNDNSGIRTGQEVEFTGTLSAMSADALVVGGQTIRITGAEIKDRLVLGALVKVHASLVNGEWVAREVELAVRSREAASVGDNDNVINVVPGCVVTQPAGWQTYTVRAGDALGVIADRADIDLDDLAEVNCIANPSAIQVGQVLFVPRAVSSGGGSSGSSGNDNGSNVNSNSNDNNDDNGNDNGSNVNSNSNDNNDDNGNDNGGGNDNDDGNDND